MRRGLYYFGVAWVVGVVDGAAVTWTAGNVGYWSDPAMWTGGAVPLETDTVIFADGTIYLGGDHVINNLKMSGGELVTGDSECPAGWSPTLDFDQCARAFAEPKTWLEAEEACAAEGGSSGGGYRGHLALVGDAETNQFASLLCGEATNATSLRLENSDAEASGEEFAPGALPCWIGLTDSLANASGASPVREQVARPDRAGAAADDGAWAWADEGAVLHDPLYRSWARHEPAFRGGDNCAALVHRGYDPAAPPRPTWRTALCGSALPSPSTESPAFSLSLRETTDAR